MILGCSSCIAKPEGQRGARNLFVLKFPCCWQAKEAKLWSETHDMFREPWKTTGQVFLASAPSCP
jgi:hypothetical protein